MVFGFIPSLAASGPIRSWGPLPCFGITAPRILGVFDNNASAQFKRPCSLEGPVTAFPPSNRSLLWPAAPSLFGAEQAYSPRVEAEQVTVGRRGCRGN